MESFFPPSGAERCDFVDPISSTFTHLIRFYKYRSISPPFARVLPIQQKAKSGPRREQTTTCRASVQMCSRIHTTRRTSLYTSSRRDANTECFWGNAMWFSTLTGQGVAYRWRTVRNVQVITVSCLFLGPLRCFCTVTLDNSPHFRHNHPILISSASHALKPLPE